MSYFIYQFDYLDVGEGLQKPNLCSMCRIVCTFDLSCCSDLFLKHSPSSLFDCAIGEECEVELGFGKGELSDILHSCIEDMKIGDKRKYTVTITKDLDDVKLGTEFQFDVQLLSFTNFDHLYSLSPEIKLNKAGKFKEIGNELFQCNKIFIASVLYSKAIKFILSIHSDKDYNIKENIDFKQAFIACKLNLSACQIKRKLYMEAIQNCSDVLLIDSSICKAFYRRGSAFSSQ